VTYRFPKTLAAKAGDVFQCEFTIGMDFGKVAITEATLFGTAEGRDGYAMRLAHVIDTLRHISDGLYPTWGDGHCKPQPHIDRAIRELTHAMLAVDAKDQ
jgi:hypothetical protein